MHTLTADDLIEHFSLLKHPEGGYYREVYRSEKTLNNLPSPFNGSRNYLTSIYFMLKSEDKSLFHRLSADEIWYFHLGTALKFYLLDPEGNLKTFILGSDFRKGEMLQVIAPANHYMAAEVIEEDSFTFISCAVAPGFDFVDFEMGDKKSMTQDYPSHAEIIDRFTV